MNKTHTQEKKMEWFGEAYRENSQPQYVWAKSIIPWISFEKGNHVLDVGAGDGKITLEIHKHHREKALVTKGMDLSESQIATANRISEEEEGISFQVENALALDTWEKDQMDRIMSFTAMHWVEDHVKLFRGLAHVLKPSGRLYLTMPFYSNCFLTEVFFNLTQREPFKPYLDGKQICWWIDSFNFQQAQLGHLEESNVKDAIARNQNILSALKKESNPADTFVSIMDAELASYFDRAKERYKERILAPNGFEPVRVEVNYIQDTFVSLASLKNYTNQWNPYKQMLPDTLHETYMDAYMEEVDRICQEYQLDPLQHVSGFYHFQVELTKS